MYQLYQHGYLFTGYKYIYKDKIISVGAGPLVRVPDTVAVVEHVVRVLGALDCQQAGAVRAPEPDEIAIV